MGKLTLLLLLFIFPNLIFGLTPENIFQNDQNYIERAIAKQTLKSDEFATLQPQDKFDLISLDPKKLINNLFTIPDHFNDSVHFWFNIYTLYDSDFSIIHDKKRFGLIYKVLNYKTLSQSVLNKYTKASLQNKFTLNKISKIKKSLKNLSLNKNIGNNEKEILQLLKKLKIKIPRNRRKRKKFYNKLSSNVRAQTGQQDSIKQGLFNYTHYQPTVKKLIAKMELPPELLVIPFLESSYNIKAVSKVGASGIWQFMPMTARHFMNQSRVVDSRLNPLISSVAALHLLKQNKKILRRWDLAVTAYNSGTRHIRKAQKKLKKRNLPLEEMLQKYKHPHQGFATQNFYSEFLALVYALAYKKDFFDHLSSKNKYKPLSLSNEDLSIYISLCKLRPHLLFKELAESSPDFKFLNGHLLFTRKSYPRGTLLVSDIDLAKGKYKKVSLKEMVSKYPKNWKKNIKNYKCSTK